MPEASSNFPFDFERAFAEAPLVVELVTHVADSLAVDPEKISIAWVHYDKNGRRIGKTDLIPGQPDFIGDTHDC